MASNLPPSTQPSASTNSAIVEPDADCDIFRPLVFCCNPADAALSPVVPNLESYIIFKRDTYHDIYNCWGSSKMCRNHEIRNVLQNPTELVMADAATNPKSILELAVRCATGCAAPLCPQMAIELTHVLLKRHGTEELGAYLLHVDLNLHTDAHAVAALAYLAVYRAKRHRAGPTSPPSAPADGEGGTLVDHKRAAILSATAFGFLNDDDLHHAAMDADKAVFHGRRCWGVFQVAHTILRLGDAVGLDVRDARRSPFAQYDALWKAWEGRLGALERVGRTPERYECARPGCAFRAMKGRRLRRCAGPCAPGVKPSYCGTECQKKDWERHKAVCGRKGRCHVEEALRDVACLRSSKIG